jgi:hypothetical protein
VGLKWRKKNRLKKKLPNKKFNDLYCTKINIGVLKNRGGRNMQSIWERREKHTEFGCN